MGITFPTTPSRGRGLATPPGLPKRADPCRCGEGPLVLGAYDDTCTRCGHYPKTTIHQTWRDRAQKLSTSRVRRVEARSAA